jgi:LuxR family transcriptional regulator, glucitol operon activator
MSFSATRLTLYAILSSIEDDLRKLIVLHLADQATSLQIFGEDLLAICQARLEKDPSVVSNEQPTHQLLFYADFGDLHKIINSNSNIVPSGIAQYMRQITGELEKLIPIRNRVAHGRPLVFADLPTTLDTAETLVTSRDIPWTELKSTLQRLKTEPSFVLSLRIPSYQENERDRRHNLPTADFDETGFLGRKKEVTDIIAACRGVYPVISIVAEGGVGKTALALKVAYELIDDANCPFEAIIWNSAKTAMLTPNEIKRVSSAIDSLGVFTSVMEQLAGIGSADPIDEILAYFQEFKILVILDNLETVLDDRIRSFLDRLAVLPQGSKILITSRLSVGAYDWPYKLQPMNSAEAVQLLRGLAEIRNTPHIVNMSNLKLAGYCEQMKNNPGWIKWFVSAVQTGKRPEDVLANPDVFLDFCMENVYGHLSEESRTLLKSMLVVPGQLSQAELAYLNSADDMMESLDVQKAILELLTTNMVTMTSVTIGSSFSSQYEISELAREYLSKYLLINTKEYQLFAKRNRQLVALEEKSKARPVRDETSPYNFRTQTRSEAIIAEYLRKALVAARRNDFSRAEDLLRLAARLSPGYFDVKRVEAIIKDQQGNISAARTAYQAAVELEPHSLTLWYGFAEFTLRRLNDVETALLQFEEAAKINPDLPEVQLRIARMKLFLGRFDETRIMVRNLWERMDLTERNRFGLYDLALQLYYRNAELLFSHKKDSEGAVSELEKLRELYSSYPNDLKDTGMIDTLRKTLPLLQKLDSAELKSRIDALSNWFIAETSLGQQNEKPLASLRLGDRLRGTVIRPIQDGFTFVRSHGDSVFMHLNDVRNREDVPFIHAGAEVEFTLEYEQKGYRALDVVLLRQHVEFPNA